MRYRKLPPSAPTTVTVPQLSGGLNLYDTPERLTDNQLTECNNMWWHQGALKTRPGLTEVREDARHYNIRQIINERERLLSRVGVTTDGKKMLFYASHLSADGGLNNLGSAAETYHGALPAEGHAKSAMGIRAEKNADTRWYYLMSGGDIIKENPDLTVTTAGQAWVAVEPYIPTVMINGAGVDVDADTVPMVNEDYNMLTRLFSCTYTTDGVSQWWKLPQDNLGTAVASDSFPDKDGNIVLTEGAEALRISVKVMTTQGIHTKTASVPVKDGSAVGTMPLTRTQAGLSTDEYQKDGVALTIAVNLSQGKVRTMVTATDNNGKPYSGALPAVVDNNLTITAYRHGKYEEERIKICRMTHTTTFGGDRSGAEGGTRLFVTGNPDEPNLVHYSGIEHPLYVPEHNYVRIGDDSQAVTAFGKQGDLLVVFKEREIYALQYVAGTEADAEFAVSGGVAITTYGAKFPVTPISPAIGCNCPGTVQLVDNRLVWMNADGHVYMLTATNQYSERNVRMISRNVREKLASHGADTLKSAQATEYEGYYLLLVGKSIYLLDTQTSAFHSFNYYSDEDSARKALPWFTWRLPEKYTHYTGIVSNGTTLRMTATISDGKSNERELLLSGDTDAGEHIPCHFATKWWDFGRPDRKKSVEEIYSNIGCLPGGRVKMTYLTEHGEHEDPYPLADHRTDAQRANRFLRRQRVTPNVRMVQMFGVRLSCDRAMEVDGLYIKVRQQGVVR